MTPREQLESELAGATVDTVAERLLGFMKQRGGGKYDEEVTQIEHALQCADLARQRDLGDAAVAAALLHDIGHLLLDEQQTQHLAEDFNHEVTGSQLLAAWFDADVTEPIRLHVAAKRYLCSTDATYYEQLSLASQRSFQVQGGNLSSADRAEFESNPHFAIAVELRRIDDEGKMPNKPVPPIEDYAATVARCVRG